METRFKDVYGRVNARNAKILEHLETAFKTSNQPLLAEAGIEIEVLREENMILRDQLKDLEAKKIAAAKPDKAKPVKEVSTVKS